MNEQNNNDNKNGQRIADAAMSESISDGYVPCPICSTVIPADAMGNHLMTHRDLYEDLRRKK